MPITSEAVEIMSALHSQVERLGLSNKPMSPVEHQLANAILVLLNVLLDERRRELQKLEAH